MAQDQADLDRLIDQLRKSLETISLAPTVPLRSAHAEAVDAIHEQALDPLTTVRIWHEAAADGLFTFTLDAHRNAVEMLRKVDKALTETIPTFAAPDTVWPGMHYGPIEDVSWWAQFCTLAEAGRRVTNWKKQGEALDRLLEMLREYIPRSRGDGSRGFDKRCDLEVVATECERMTAALTAYRESYPVPVEALVTLIRELGEDPTGENEITQTASAQGIAYRLVGELYGYKWQTVKGHVDNRPQPERAA